MENRKIIDKLKITNTEGKNQMDFLLFSTILILLCLGLIMVASASSYYALSSFGNSNYFLVRQLEFAAVGVIAMIIISNIDYNIYKKFSYIGFAFAVLLMISVLIPGIGQERNGATRWLGFGAFTFQPSEFMKIALVMATATYIAINYRKTATLKGYFVPIGMLVLVMGIMFLQNHLSGAVIMIVASASIIFASGIKIKAKYVIIGSFVMALMVAGFLIAEPFRINRLVAFMNPEQDILGDNYQAVQSLYAIGSGHIFGMGLGQSRQKYLWLPEAQNDFIFSVLGEELGLVGTVGVLGIFTFFIYRGYLTALRCQDMYGSLIATGITSVFAIQILVNIAVVTCSMPVTGMPLPFFSYGGTALLINLCAMGVLLNVSKRSKL
ncbi:MAG: putative lipid II flippase FtsW [Clostridia bacterium]|nr:putative lipid II flippase FtsW [Clostridia bacterium]